MSKQVDTVFDVVFWCKCNGGHLFLVEESHWKYLFVLWQAIQVESTRGEKEWWWAMEASGEEGSSSQNNIFFVFTKEKANGRIKVLMDHKSHYNVSILFCLYGYGKWGWICMLSLITIMNNNMWKSGKGCISQRSCSGYGVVFGNSWSLPIVMRWAVGINVIKRA